MANSKKILIVDDNRGVLSALRLLLRSRGYDVETFDNPANVSAVSIAEAGLIVLDMNFKSTVNNGNEGFYWLSRFLKICPTTPVVLITAFAEISVAVRGIKEGAADFIVKPWDNNKFIEVVEAAMKQPVSKINNPDAGCEALIWGTSEKSSRLLGLIQKAAPTDANILINGENGTGKGLIAEEIHRRSLRRNFGLTVVDVGALPESLFESELFGYAKGAFTGATASRAGKIESATGGTLFLDEIGNLPIHLQSKLLTVLQSRQVTRLGENKPVPVDIRLICATNRNLGEMVAAGQFREDLYYRINTISLTLEPLRNRPEDIEVLAKAFVAEFSEAYGKNVEIGLETIQFLQRHPWPGNIRQLRHAVENAVIMSDDRILQPSDFTLDTVSYNSGKTKPTGTLADMEKTMIAEAMTECGGNLTAVATRLGITRQTLYNKIKKMGL
ncbi:sigma-54-dependent Fis family transcriptional regulator [Muribaculaceae bacterium Isolate-104 (HZI)]|nr:sigma-54-dependent Fis family transcriptional regulator [Muribaculaceae bacterium Isolate-104 (HZI)]